MTDKVHAKLGASSAKRWMKCPGSLSFIESQPDFLLDTTSEYAEEGTAAHELAEKCLRTGRDVEDRIEDEAVQVYLDEVRSHLTGFNELYIEERFKLNDEMFGTNDAIIVDFFESTIHVFDYKHGAGVAVEVEENEQLMYYALGAIKRFDPNWQTIKHVNLCIVQPRCHHIDGPVRRWKTTAERIRMFETQLLLAASATRAKDAPLSAGDHCRFCSAVAVCPAYRKAIMEGLNNPTLAHVMEAANSISSYRAAVNRVIFKSLMSNKPVKGFKLVKGKKHRIWIDPKRVEMLLNDKDQCFTRALKSPAQVEKLIGKEFVNGHSMKPDGELKVAFEHDERDGWNKGIDDFADIPAEE